MAKQSHPKTSSATKVSFPLRPSKEKRKPFNKAKKHFIPEQYNAKDETEPTSNPGRVVMGNGNVRVY